MYYLRLILILPVILATPCVLFGQYFGKNTVQFRDFDFKILQTEHFNVFYYPGEKLASLDASNMLERWHARLIQIFNDTLKNQPVIIYAQPGDFHQTNIIGGIIPQGVGGVTEGIMNRVVLPLTGVYSDNDHVIGHELVHAFQYSVQNNLGGGVAQGTQMPLWFIEGMAEYLSIGSHSPLTAMWMRDAVLHDDIPDLSKLASNPEYFPYRYGHAVWGFLAGTWGDSIVNTLYLDVMRKGWNRGFISATGMNTKDLSANWQNMIREQFTPQLNGRTPPSLTGHILISGYGDVNLSPVISPDGSRIAFISARDPLQLDMYIADVKSGKVLKRLAESMTDEHFDALRFFSSAGAWSPDGQTFAAIVFRKGINEIAFIDISTMKTSRTVKVENVTDIQHISWSPDGNSMVLSGTVGGIGDLFLYDIKSGNVTRLTDDRFADIQPSWSPDGSTIVFATDRGPKTSFDSLVYGPLRIGLLSVSDKSIKTIAIDNYVNHINPSYRPDGKSIFFIAEPDGFNDIYSYTLESEEFCRHTRIATGVSGLTENSMAMSIARDTALIVFNVFDKKGYLINSAAINEFQTLSVQSDYSTFLENTNVSPSKSNDTIVNAYLEESFSDKFSSDTLLSTKDYNPKLRLAYLGQLFAGVTLSGTGTGWGAGISLVFSDLLGDYLSGISAQSGGSIGTTGGELIYLNRKGRFHWGAGLSRIPYAVTQAHFDSDSLSSLDSTMTGQFTIEQQQITSNQVTFLSEYPYSVNRRLEFSASFNRVNFGHQVDVVSVVGGRITEREKISRSTPSPLNLVQSGIAYVGDFSFNGATGPASGRRFRYEVAPTIGTLKYVSALFDYRHYLYFRPLTIAFRGYHSGRYFGDADNSRLSTLYLGNETMIRGYDITSFESDECTDTNNNCPEFDKLIGSKTFVANGEIRLPIFSVQRLGLVTFPLIPLDLVGFVDGGVAWTGSDLPVLRYERSSTDRIPVFSIGAATRINVLGLLILQIYYAYPFQRPEKGGYFGFVLAPGW